MVESLKNYSFTTLANIDEGLFKKDDYANVYANMKTWKVKGSTEKGGKFVYKAKVKDLSAAMDDELQIQFPYQKYTTWVGVKRNGALKIHFDLGQHLVGGYSMNFFTNLRTTTKFSDYLFRFGTNHWHEKCESNTRLESNPYGGSGVCLTQRLLIRKSPFYYGLVGTFAFDTLKATRYDGIIGYNKDKKSVWLRHDSGATTNKASTNGVVDLTAVCQVDKNTWGLQATRDSKGEFGASGAYQRDESAGVLTKAKFNNKLQLEVCHKRKMNSLFSFTLSCKLDLSKGVPALDWSQATPFPVGWVGELNI